MSGALHRAYDATWGRVFASLYDRMLDASEVAGLRETRAELLAGASGRTLELGAGTGLNLDHYPADVELTLTEPFGPMARHLRERLAASGRSATVLEADAEELPVPDDSQDTVVATLVLCTIPEPERALAEVARVLRPGGRLLFCEHVRSDDPATARWQDRLNRPWRFIGHGCNCNRDTVATIEASPLALESLERGRVPKAAPIVRPMATGVARA